MRNKIQHLICICILVCCVSSCVFAGKDILYGQPKGFVNDYSEKINDIDQMIKVDGYYQSDELSFDNIFSLMLYRDGTIFSTKTSSCSCTSSGCKLDSILILPEIQKLTAVNRWGSYQICDSSIHVQTIGAIEVYYVAHNYILEIINDTTLLYKPIIRKNAKNETIEVWDYDTTTTELHFHPLPDRVDSTCWVKSKKWFWKDREAYKKYKKELKERKKQK